MTNQEINEAVARKLGWKLVGQTWYPPNQATSDLMECPTFCTSIAAAWELVDTRHLSGVMRIGLGWRAIGNNGATVASDLQADTAPMAIALCFLKLP